jgi:hypothetical protein
VRAARTMVRRSGSNGTLVMHNIKHDAPRRTAFSSHRLRPSVDKDAR